MNITCILTAYNEAKYLPLKLAFCKANGINLYVIDNYSNDGTWEWLQAHNVPSHRFDTNEAFDLPALQGEIIQTLHRIKPDWVVYNGADLFPVTPGPLCHHINDAEAMGYNLISMLAISMHNTGEPPEPFDPFNTYFYYNTFMHVQLIHKYHPDVKYCADHVWIPDQHTITVPGVMINYGQTKTQQEREETLKRRQRAWKNGMKHGHGQHMREGNKLGWKWDKDKLKDIRNSEYAPYINKLQRIKPIK
ncbi:MAG TPA: hypothetical protein P5531_03895 [Bacteroidales bacterium]|nr:hypothetical protein [Bacteroidales bacterium]